MRLIALAVTTFALASTTSAVAAEGYRPKVGDVHPDVTLPTIADGTPISLSDYRGRKVLLIHFASW